MKGPGVSEVVKGIGSGLGLGLALIFVWGGALGEGGGV